MVDRQAMCHARAAIVADDGEAIETEVLHHFDLIQRHGALRVIGVVRSALGLAAVAVAAQVGRDDRVFLGELGRDPVPDRMRLGGAVQKSRGGPLPAMTTLIVAPDVCTFTALKPGNRFAGPHACCRA